MHDKHLLIRRMAARLEASVLVAGLAIMLGAAGWLLGGPQLAWAAFVAVAGLYWLQPLVAPQMILKIQGGRPLAFDEAPRLHQMVRELARQAGLERPPRLYYLPAGVMNAFTIGEGERAIVGISDGLLRHLSRDALAAVLAHEIAHIRNNDTRVVGFRPYCPS
jgi:heat shock protein HtpX